MHNCSCNVWQVILRVQKQLMRISFCLPQGKQDPQFSSILDRAEEQFLTT